MIQNGIENVPKFGLEIDFGTFWVPNISVKVGIPYFWPRRVSIRNFKVVPIQDLEPKIEQKNIKK